MARKINLSNEKGRDTVVNFQGQTAKKTTRFVTPDGAPIKNKKYIKSTAKQSLAKLVEKYGSLEDLADAIISEDPELDFEVTGKFLTQTSRVYVNDQNKVVFRIKKTEKIFDNKGGLKDSRPPKQLIANINTDKPLKWSGKMFPKSKIYNKFVFIRKYQIIHDSGLKYDFLYDIAKKLQEKNAMMLIGSGKGTGPAIMQDGGKPFRIFLEGKVKGEEYLLLMHISNLELKPIPE